MVSQFSHGESDLTGISASAFNISQLRYARAHDNFESAIAKCRKKRKSIPASLITPLGMTLDEVKAALFILNHRAVNICEGDKLEKFLYAAAVHRVISKYYGVNAGTAGKYTDDFIFTRHWTTLEFEVKYLNIDENIREKLESIEELKSPFLIFQTLDEIKEAD